MEIKEIKDELYKLAGAEKASAKSDDGSSSQYASFSKALNPTSLPMLGVRLPELHKIAKKLPKMIIKSSLAKILWILLKWKLFRPW